jgi:hypothetical protein
MNTNRLLAIALLSLTAPGLCPAQHTWVGGGGNEDLSTPANWKGGQLPAVDETLNLISFDSAEHLAPHNDCLQSVAVLVFEPATAGMTLSGEPIQVGNTAPQNNHAIIVNGAGTRTITADLRFIGRKGFLRNISIDPSATLVLDGVLSSDKETPNFRSFTLRKWLEGTLIINGANAILGFVDFEVGEGAVYVNNKTGSGLGSANVTVGTKGILGGDGSVAGSLTATGSVRPGASGNGTIGTLSVNGGMTWRPNWTPFGFDLGKAAPTQAAAASGNSTQDQLAIGGDFLKDPKFQQTCDFDFQGGGEKGWYKLIEWTGTTDFTPMDFTASNLAPGLGGTFSIQDNALYLEVTQ